MSEAFRSIEQSGAGFQDGQEKKVETSPIIEKEGLEMGADIGSGADFQAVPDQVRVRHIVDTLRDKESASTLSDENIDRRKRLHELLDKRYDFLLDENERLQTELTKEDSRKFSNILINKELATPEALMSIRNAWLESVRAESTFLEIPDSFKIELFKDNLEEQPHFPHEEIRFGAVKLLRKNLKKTDGLIGAEANIDDPLIEISSRRPDLRDQLNSVLLRGKIDIVSEAMVHELIHRFHKIHTAENKNNFSKESRSLSEAQAQFSDLILGGNKSAALMLDNLATNKSYRFESEINIALYLAMSTLKALGYNSAEIGKMVAQSKSVKEFLDHSDERIAEKGFDVSSASYVDGDEVYHDLAACKDLLYLETLNNQYKAQLLLRQSIRNQFSDVVLEKMVQADMLESAVTIPAYSYKGKPVDAQKSFQLFTVLNNEEYPYDPEGMRTGIIVGVFEVDGKQQFQVGRLEAYKNDSDKTKLSFAQTPKETEQYLEKIKKYAEGFPLEQRVNFLRIYFPLVSFSQNEQSGCLQDVFHAYISKEHVKETLSAFLNLEIIQTRINDVLLPTLKERLAYFEHQKKLSEDTVHLSTAAELVEIFKYLNTIRAYLDLENLYEINVEDDQYFGTKGTELKEYQGRLRDQSDRLIEDAILAVEQQYVYFTMKDRNKEKVHRAAYLEYYVLAQQVLEVLHAAHHKEAEHVNQILVDLNKTFQQYHNI